MPSPRLAPVVMSFIIVGLCASWILVPRLHFAKHSAKTYISKSHIAQQSFSFAQSLVANMSNFTVPILLPSQHTASAVKGHIVVVGIFCNAHSYARDTPLRDAFRSSARAHDGPLSLWFFFGRGAEVSEENSTHKDIIVGAFDENMNEGKSFEWLRAAVGMDASFVVKMDLDTVVKWPRLMELMLFLKPPVYFGTRLLEWGLDLSASPVSNSIPPSNECRDFAGECWFYMSGGFYGVSMDVARAIVACPFANENVRGAEDAVTGLWIHRCFPSVGTVELPFGFVHYHYNVGKRDLEANIMEQRISAAPAVPSESVVSVYLNGGLGNQLFQAASSFGIATSRGQQWCIPYLDGSVLQQSVVFLIPPVACVPEGVGVADENGGFMEFQQWMMHGEQSVRVGTYLQSYRYFASSGLPFELRSLAFGRSWVEERGIVLGIDVRRAYQLGAAHGARDPGAGYFENALKLLMGVLKAERVTLSSVVCTDDPDWVRSQPVFDGMYIRNGTNPAHEDMAILSSCKHMILSSGTFGWWASYMRMFEGETLYYATPFQSNLSSYEHFPTHWTPVF